MIVCHKVRGTLQENTGLQPESDILFYYMSRTQDIVHFSALGDYYNSVRHIQGLPFCKCMVVLVNKSIAGEFITCFS